MSAELLDAAREYAIAEDRYQAACLRLAMVRGIQNVPAEEWDDATRAACRAANAAQSRLTDLCSHLFPQPGRKEMWKEYSARFWPTPASEQDRRCPDCQNWLDRYGRCLQCAEPAGEL